MHEKFTMADIFMSRDIKRLLKGKFILLMGDSNFRAVYRDIVWLLNNNSIIPASHLRRKLDFSYLGDRLLKQGKLNRGRDYIEMREYKNHDFHVKFNFLTKCYTKEIEDLIKEYKRNKCSSPDIILINSCLWDITRWGPNGVDLYKENMQKLFSLFKTNLSPRTLVVFSTTLPVSANCQGAFLVKQVEFMKHSLRFEVMEANLYARQLVPAFNYNVLDFHYHFRMQIHMRAKDGVHWFPAAVRHMTNLFLTHISLSWAVQLPGNFTGKSIDRMKANLKEIKNSVVECTLPKSKVLYSPIMAPPPKPCRRQQKARGNFSKNIENISPVPRKIDLKFITRSPLQLKNSTAIKSVVIVVEKKPLSCAKVNVPTSLNIEENSNKKKDEVSAVTKQKIGNRFRLRRVPY